MLKTLNVRSSWVEWDDLLNDNRDNGSAPAASRTGLTVFARAWAKAVTGTSYLPMAQTELESMLQDLTVRFAQALVSEPFSLRDGYQIGADLVAAHIVSAEGLGRTVEVINLRLLRDLDLSGEDVEDRLARLLGTVATGYTRALRDRTLDEQEAIRRAAMVARVQAEWALRESEARFRHQATHDPLTGLPNRTQFSERLSAIFDSPETVQRVGVCLIDLDWFKMINETIGHEVGDLLLVSVANRLRRAVAGHLVARMGGDEFVILVSGSSGTDDMVKLAEAALAAITEAATINGHELIVSASIGVVERPVASGTASDLMRAANITLHWAKQSGKNRWALFDPERNERELTRYALSAQMPAALDRGEFYLDYQPLVALDSGAIVGVEALVRWRHPERGVLGPDNFVGLAEETGLIVRLGGRVLSEACQQAQRWSRLTTSTPFISVNLAVRQVHDPGLVAEVTTLLDHTGLPPDRLQLEITESALMNSADEPVQALRLLASLGVRIAIDDFGTGYSNLAYLRALPVTELKIAGVFVEGLRTAANDPASQTDERILATLVSLAHTLNLTVTAEGVETAEQAERLRAIGCDSGQGWFFGAPAPAAQIIDRL